jgi:hypothetical protein
MLDLAGIPLATAHGDTVQSAGTGIADLGYGVRLELVGVGWR